MTRLSSKKPPRNIQRVDNDSRGDHGWVVTLQRKGAILVKRFSDGVYGGKREALKAAVKHRDSFLALDRPIDHQIWIRTRLRKNNRSGIPGVVRYEVKNDNAEKVRTYWIAAWTDEHGATRQRKFPVARYGEEHAKELAIAEREYQINRVCAINAENRKFHHPDQERVWEETRAKGRNREHNRIILRRKARNEDGSDRGVQVIKATIDRDGNVKLHEPVELPSTRRALVTILPAGRRDRPKH